MACFGGLARAKVLVNACRHLPAFGNGPNDERGAAFGIAAGKDAVEAGHEVFIGSHRTSCVVLHTEAVQEAIFDRAGEAHRKQDQIRVHFEIALSNRRELPVLELHPIGVELRHLAIVAGELGRRDTPLPIAAFFMRM